MSGTPFFRLTAAVLAVLALAAPLGACPFCETVRETLTQQTDAADAAVIAVPLPPGESGPPRIGRNAVFRIVKILNGAEAIGEERQIPVLYFGDAAANQKFLVLGNRVPQLRWHSPIPLSDASFAYLNRQLALPRDSADRIAEALTHLDSDEKVLRQDAYDEFARAPYDHLLEIKSQLDPAELLTRIRDEEVPWEMRRLYLTLLGVCGQSEHVADVEQMLREQRHKGPSMLDALAACYLTLHGPAGLPLLEELYLSSEAADEMARAAAVISALRFHGERDREVPRAEILQVLRRTLARPQLAGKTLVDLARWEDWSIVDQVAELYDQCGGESAWVRSHAFRYLQQCPLPVAAGHLDAILAEDPEAAQRHRSYFPIETVSTTDTARAAGETPHELATAPSAAGNPQVEAGEATQPRPAESAVRRVAWLAIFPVAAGCLAVLLFWVWRSRPAAGPEDPDVDGTKAATPKELNETERNEAQAEPTSEAS
ncbi:MAG: hypothetical protein DWQ42_14745 [Planctomycetota bacterium]|nr:MAG: hypothetical protein DWQ42_14745 [Planctomycetota bacterium]REK47603.1 MAG: hypothetical protein DWQ46_04025 [Planctomycetota bacterium]